MNQYTIRLVETNLYDVEVRASTREAARSFLGDWSPRDLEPSATTYAIAADAPSTTTKPAHVLVGYEGDRSPTLPEDAAYWLDVNGERWATNGHVALAAGEQPPETTEPWKTAEECGPSAASCLVGAIAAATVPLHFAEPRQGEGYHHTYRDCRHVESAPHDASAVVAIDARYHRRWATCDWFGTGRAADPVVAKRNGRAVAVVSPLRGNRGVFEALRDYVAAPSDDGLLALRALLSSSAYFPVEVRRADLLALLARVPHAP